MKFIPIHKQGATIMAKEIERRFIVDKQLILANDFRELVNELRDASVQYHAHQCLREVISRITHKYLQPASKKEIEESVDCAVYW